MPPGSESGRRRSSEILRRLLLYADRVYRLPALLRGLQDRRQRPRIRAASVVCAVFLLFLARMGSLHALEQTRGRRFWHRWLQVPMPSADSIGRIFEGIDLDGFREVSYELYHRFRRNKVFADGDPAVLILDGHETSASYRRHCDGCLQRRVKTAAGERIQYYHRNVTALLQAGRFVFLLDAEPQQLGEDEVAVGVRLFERVVRHLPRAFEVVLADGLYAQTRFVKSVRACHKHLLAVLKENRPDLLRDARGLFACIPPVADQQGRTERHLWDEEGFTSWDGFEDPVRVVRSLETTVVRHADESEETRVADWFWVTTLSPEQASTEQAVRLGHRRWTIENQGFNELVSHWHADHVYRHDPTAIMGFWLMALLTYNLFHAFVSRRIQPALRRGHTVLHWAREMAADLYRDIPVEAWPLPP